MLQPLGISAEAEAVYLVLAPLEISSVADLASRCGSEPGHIQVQLSELKRLGLAAETAAGQWQALPLVDAAQSLRALRQSELDVATTAAETLQNHLLAAMPMSEGDGVTVLIGRDSIVAAHHELCDSTKKELCAFDKPPYVKPRPNATPVTLHEDSPEWKILDRGLSHRAVYHPGFDADRLSELQLFAAKGEKSRTAPVPMKLMLFDKQVAMIPSMRSYAPGHELRASVVRHPLLVEALQWLFEAVWDASVPIVTSAYAEINPRRQMLIALLMTGSTDSAIATQLGINVRSVRRWISDLMDELGVSTRLQLGAALVRADSIRHSHVVGQGHAVGL